MRIAQLVTGLVGLILGSPEPAEAVENGQGQYYSGAEWVLDGDGRVIASSAVLVERMLDIPHRRLETKVLRESPRDGVLPTRTMTSVTLVATTVSPYTLEGLAERDGARIDIVERAVRQVLVIREAVRSDDGRTGLLHILDATPIGRDDYASMARRFAANY